MDVLPLGDRVLVRKTGSWNEREEASLIVVEDKPELETGEVLALGQGKLVKGNRIGFDFAIGDTVLFNRYAGADYPGIEEERLFLSAGEILAVVQG